MEREPLPLSSESSQSIKLHGRLMILMASMLEFGVLYRANQQLGDYADKVGKESVTYLDKANFLLSDHQLLLQNSAFTLFALGLATLGFYTREVIAGERKNIEDIQKK